MAFAPDYASSGRFYVHYTDTTGDVRVDEFRRSAASADRASASSRRTVLRQNHRAFPNHNGGQLAFGPDRYLYIGIGDGGASNDPLGSAPAAGHAARQDPADRPAPARRAPLHRAAGQSVRRPRRRAAGDLRVRAAQPLAVLVRPRERRAHDRRRRRERLRGGQPHAVQAGLGRELRLARVRGRHEPARRHRARPRPAGAGQEPRGRLQLDHRRLRRARSRARGRSRAATSTPISPSRPCAAWCCRPAARPTIARWASRSGSRRRSARTRAGASTWRPAPGASTASRRAERPAARSRRAAAGAPLRCLARDRPAAHGTARARPRARPRGVRRRRRRRLGQRGAHARADVGPPGAARAPAGAGGAAGARPGWLRRRAPRGGRQLRAARLPDLAAR